MTPEPASDWPALPTETEIYILPDGQVVIADLPAELADLLRHLAQPTAPQRVDDDTIDSPPIAAA